MKFDLENDNVDDFFSELTDEIEEFPKPPEPEPEPEQEPEQEAIEDDPFTEIGPSMDLDLVQELNNDASEIITDAMNGLIAFLIALWIAQNSESEKYLLPEKTLRKIQLLVSKMMPRDKVILPNWAALLMLLTTAYTPVFSLASADRKIAEQEAEIERLKNEAEKKEE